ncbi:Transcriptional regulator of ribosomal biogenesis protein, partial [Dissophora ornata]
FDGGDFQQSSSSSTLVDNVHAREFETAFCRDFYCCGLRLVDLHDLLQHYEECHVRFEDDDDDDGDYYDEEMAESDFVDEDGWSDSDSAPASPSSIEMPGSSLALALGTLSSSSGGGPLSTLQQQQQQVFHHHSPFVTAAVDLMRQRDEVYSLMEDLSRTGTTHNTGDKPYRCTVLGCDKAYKNPNGLKYHNLHGHCTGNNGCDGDSAVESRPYVCTFLECGKRYKNLNGLKYHIEHSHPNLTAALKAHQSGLIHSTDLFGQYPSQAAMTVAAAVQAVNSSPMMMAAANAILASQAANANNANAASAVTATMPPGGPQTTTTSPLDHQRLVLGPRVAVDGGGGGGEGIGPPGVDPRLVSGVGPGIGSSPGEIKDNMCG